MGLLWTNKIKSQWLTCNILLIVPLHLDKSLREDNIIYVLLFKFPGHEMQESFVSAANWVIFGWHIHSNRWHITDTLAIAAGLIKLK